MEPEMTVFSYQLYSSRFGKPLAETLNMLKSLGYGEVEGYGGVYGDLPALKAALAAAGLRMPTGHFGLDMIENEPAKVLEIVRAAGMSAVFCPYIAEPDRPTDAAGWRAFGARLEKAGKPLVDAGLTFGWHNHHFEFFPLADGSLPMEHIFAGGPSLAWEADIAWIVVGGANPLAWLERYSNRLAAVHVKDIAPKGECADEDGWADVGQGTMDWRGLFKFLASTPAKHFILEHDKPSDDRRFASRSMEFLKTL
jgi:sugar phosphate isomerase/epimerase